MNRLKRIIAALLCTAVITSLAACSQPQTTPSISPNASQTTVSSEIQQDFDSFLDDLFKKSFTNSIDLHFTLKDPSKYGIELDPSIGTLSYESYKESVENNKNLLNNLRKYSLSDLTQEQQLTYRILEDYLTTQQSDYDFYYHGNAIGYISGLPANYPLIFSEYTFYTEQNIKDYLTILEQLGGYLANFGEYLKEQSAKGLFVADFIADTAIDQIASITNNPNNLFVSSFKDKVNSFEELDEATKQQYIEQNNTVVQHTVIPAFEQLSNTISSLKGTGYEGGLCQAPNGKAYYEALVKQKTGSSKSISELFALLKTRQQEIIKEVQTILMIDSTILDKSENLAPESRTAQEIMDILIEKSKNDYPELNHIDYQIKEVPDYLKGIFASPAAYIVPPIDAMVENTIYINSNTQQSQNFSTLAHEGYPGHLYQNNYFISLNKHPILSLLSYMGYTEGWATYVQFRSYEWDSAYQGNKNLSKLSALNQEYGLLLSSYFDIAINYYGWSLEKMNQELAKLSLPEMPDLYKHVVSEPCNYLQYYIGYLEIEELRKKAENQLGEQFVAKEFNKVILDTGPCSFKIMQEEVDRYIEGKK